MSEIKSGITPVPAEQLYETTVHVAPFTVQDDHLAVMLVSNEQGDLSLLSTPLLPRHSSGGTPLGAAKEALHMAFQDTAPTLEPVLSPTLVQAEGANLRLGYVAATRLVTEPPADTLTIVPLQAIGESVELSTADHRFVASGLARLRPLIELGWSATLTMPETVTILSRLVANPRGFTLDELRLTHQALLYDSLPSAGFSPWHQLYKPNFARTVRKSLQLLNTRKQVPNPHGQGRTATLWAMPRNILRASEIANQPEAWQQ